MGSKRKNITATENRSPKELKCICNVVCPVNHENDKYKQIRGELLRKRVLYDDPDFPAANSSIGSDGYVRNLIGNNRIHWRRPWEITTNPKFFVEGPTRFDIVQGAVGDCWFLASIAVLASNEKVLHQVVPKDQSFTDNYAGIFYFRFWQYGRWATVIVDDLLPTYNNGKTLISIKSSQSNEFWSALLEKAYAKLHGSYEAIDGGYIGVALEDLTGGLTEWLTADVKKEKELFQKMIQAHKRGSLIGASVLYSGEYHNSGIVGGHAYSVTNVRYLDLEGIGKKRMVRVRNPWGNAKEWTGQWNDEDPIWKKVSKEVKEKLDLKDRDDGEYWMDIKDFCKYFSSVEVTQLNLVTAIDPITKNKWEITELHGSWVPGVSAGGNISNKDGFHSNPQYRLTLHEHDDDDAAEGDEDNDGSHQCTVIVSVMQKNRRQADKENLMIAFYIIKVSDAESKVDESFFARHGYGSIVGMGSFKRRAFRSCTERFQLAPGYYCIVPTTYYPGEQGEFLIRIFTEKHHTAKE